jgi:hypothetical protein
MFIFNRNDWETRINSHGYSDRIQCRIGLEEKQGLLHILSQYSEIYSWNDENDSPTISIVLKDIPITTIKGTPEEVLEFNTQLVDNFTSSFNLANLLVQEN